ncbi:STS14 protein [Mercurialis annua]|uniref:STS14 protein n=1 Tax=Mercurialis annua TaxID=3986 RepID=UPI00215E1795|nr:STS14 protein [Mercurialis annua]
MASPLLPLLILVIFHGYTSLEAASQAPPSPPPQPPLSAAARDFLAAHNQARASVGVTPLKWSETLANATNKLVRYQRNKMGCQFANLTNSKYGGNQLWASGLGVTPLMAVDNWVQEKVYYNHSTNTCVPSHQCGVYTQVVWRKSLELGCAQGFCVKEQASLTVCFYNPPGNYVGESPY